MNMLTMPGDSLHIGLIASDLSRSHGWAQYSLQIARELAAQGVRLTIVTATDSPDLPDLPAFRLLPTLNPIPRGLLPRLLTLAPRMRGLLAGCDVIHVLAEPYAPLGALVAGKRPLYITGHGSYVRLDAWLKPPQRWVYRRAFRQARRVLCVSAYTEAQAQIGTPGVRAQVLLNGVDAVRFAGIEHAPIDDAARTAGEFHIVSVGAVKPRKGTLELVRAIAALRPEIPGVQAVIAGSLTLDPAYAAAVQREIAALDAGDTIRLAGHVPQAALFELLARADVFALPSMNAGWHFEGFGLALLEASAAGLPVIGTRGCGAESAVVEGVTGLLVDQARIAGELPAALLRLARDPALARRMSDAGRAYAASQSWAKVASALVDVYGAGLRA